MHKPIRLLATLALASAASAAGATTITYSFTGATAGSYQEISDWTYNSTTGISNNTFQNTSINSATGSMSFTVDASRYTDFYGGTDGRTSFYSSSAAQPWLTSTSTVSGPVLISTLDTSGTVSSSLYAQTPTSGFGDGYFTITDFATYDETSTYNTDQLITSYHQSYTYNYVYLNGDVILGLVDGEELVTALGTLDYGRLYQYSYKLLTTYSYDEHFSRSYVQDTHYRYTGLPLASLTITRSDAPVAAVPEPTSLALMGLGLAALTVRRRRG